MTSTASNLAMRLGTAAVMVPVILGLLYPGPPWAFYLLVLTVALVGTQELFAMTHPGDGVSQAFGVFAAAASSVALYFYAEDPRIPLTILVAVPVIGPLFTLVRLGKIESAALRACALGFGPLFVAVPLTLLPLMRRELARPGALGDVGSGVVLLCLGLSWFADTCAYFAGRFLGRHKLYEAVSPKKTLEGAIGGLLGSVVFALVGSLWFLRGSLPVAHAVPLAIVAGALGQAGDLAESVLKRSTGIKDSGGIVPGHGGILDRVDALLLTTVVVFFYQQWVGFG
ncbi:MAG TPA: phosphatidate cytidylyltransferase [Polyangiaceae bacterium]|jgi:phosphatidate cytidylyltransferase|nr:phosphatidate cytidylyltransferase [Polyangiaceae bacterium]